MLVIYYGHGIMKENAPQANFFHETKCAAGKTCHINAMQAQKFGLIPDGQSVLLM